MSSHSVTRTTATNRLQRSLKARHLTMIAIGGCIGTGLFVASGTSIAQAGPGGALVAYGIIGVMVYFLMTSLGELAAFMPYSGSFLVYGSSFIDPGFGFALGWNYWYNWSITVAVELVAAAVIMQYWFPTIPGTVWSALFLAIIFLLNICSVKGFAETEYWCALIKVATVIFFIVLGLLTISGILHETSDNMKHGMFSLFTLGDAPFVGGFPAIISVSMIAGFSFQGTELIGIAAGESEEPQKAIPRATKQIFWRILLFYGLTIFVIACLIPYTDTNLLNAQIQQIGISPFTLLFQRVGLAFSASVMNSVILSAILSAGNSGLYAASRTLYNLALSNMAPTYFKQLSNYGIPIRAVCATTLIAALCFLSSLWGEQRFYLWLLNASGMTGFIVWLGIAVAHYRFRRGYCLQGYQLSNLPYRAKWFPVAPIFAFMLCLLVMFGQEYQCIIRGDINWSRIMMTYFSVPAFIILWVVYRLIKKTSFVSYHEMIFSSQDHADKNDEIHKIC